MPKQISPEPPPSYSALRSNTYYSTNDQYVYTVEATELVTLELATSGQHGATFEAQRGANTGTINPAPLAVSEGSSSRHCQPSEALTRDINAAGAHIDLYFDNSSYRFVGAVGWGRPYDCTYDDPDTLGDPTDYGAIWLQFGSCGPTVADPTAPTAPYTDPAHLAGSCDHPQSATHNLHIVWDLVGTP
ncbi:MAG TPA: hypothetical protein VJN18_23690 [Polyangiaceae bacterium]|nr:hypothetical protein [Polyangiaceae bacterium]